MPTPNTQPARALSWCEYKNDPSGWIQQAGLRPAGWIMSRVLDGTASPPAGQPGCASWPGRLARRLVTPPTHPRNQLTRQHQLDPTGQPASTGRPASQPASSQPARHRPGRHRPASPAHLPCHSGMSVGVGWLAGRPARAPGGVCPCPGPQMDKDPHTQQAGSEPVPPAGPGPVPCPGPGSNKLDRPAA